MTQPISDSFPVLIGVGQAQEAVSEDLHAAASHTQMAARAAHVALEDAGLAGQGHIIDTLFSVRSFADSSPAYACPFGRPKSIPHAVAAQIGAAPTRAVYDVIGGQSPQVLVAEAVEALQAGDAQVVLIAGGEALATQQAAQRAGVKLDWSDDTDGETQDRGLFSGPPIVTPTELAHGLMDAMRYYSLIETARRLKAGRSVEAHRQDMAARLAPFSDVASSNPYALSQRRFTAEELSTPSAENRPVASPYLKHIVAKDRVNQGAAVLLTTVGQAKTLGVDPAKWVFLRGHAEAQENVLLDRTELGGSVALEAVLKAAIEASGARPDHVDIYSCFPIVVELAQRALNWTGASTLTGGLPFFGGPGNNYTLHGIAECVKSARAKPGSLALAHGNGGWLSKQAVGIYSTHPGQGPVLADKAKLEAALQSQDHPGWTATPSGEARLLSHSVAYRRGTASDAVIIGALKESGERFYAKLSELNAKQMHALAEGEYDHAALSVTPGVPANRATLIL